MLALSDSVGGLSRTTSRACSGCTLHSPTNRNRHIASVLSPSFVSTHSRSKIFPLPLTAPSRGHLVKAFISSKNYISTSLAFPTPSTSSSMPETLSYAVPYHPVSQKQLETLSKHLAPISLDFSHDGRSSIFFLCWVDQVKRHFSFT